MRLSLDSIEVLHSEPQQYLQQVSHPVCSDTMLMQMWLSWKLEGLIVVFFYLVDHVMITRTHTPHTDTHLHQLVGFLPAYFQPKGLSHQLQGVAEGIRWLLVGDVDMLMGHLEPLPLRVCDLVGPQTTWAQGSEQGVCVCVCARLRVCTFLYLESKSLV